MTPLSQEAAFCEACPWQQVSLQGRGTAISKLLGHRQEQKRAKMCRGTQEEHANS